MEEYEDVSKLKADLKAQHVSTKQLYDSMENLGKLLSDMFSMFKNASEQMKLEEKQEEERKKAHEEILKKMDELIKQNETIATGMVDVSDLVKEKLSKIDQQPVVNPPKPQWQPPQPGGPGIPKIGASPGPVPGASPPITPPPPGIPPGRAMPPPPGDPLPAPPGMSPNVPPPGQKNPPPLDLPDLDEIPIDEPKKKKGFHLFGKK